MPATNAHNIAGKSSMSKVYLHIGLPKTGTTAIQAYLDLASEQLRKSNIIYIDTQLACNFSLSLLAKHTDREYSTAQQFFYKSRFSLAGIFPIDENYTYPEIQRRYFHDMEQMLSQKASSYIISSEFLSLADTAGIASAHFARELKKIFSGKDVYIICYLRSPEKLLASFYKEVVKGGHCAVREQLANLALSSAGDPQRSWIFSECIQNLVEKRIPVFSPESVLGFYADIFGREKILLRTYNEDKQFDIIDDFLSIFSLRKDSALLPPATVNKSLSSRMASYRIAYGQDGSPQSSDISSHAILAETALQSLGKLSPETIRHIQQSAENIRREYAVDLPFHPEMVARNLQSDIPEFEVFVCSALGKLARQNNEILTRLRPVASPAVDFTRWQCPVFSSPAPSGDIYADHARHIFESRWFTSRGPYVQRLEHSLENYLQVPYVTTFANDSLMWMLLLRSEQLQGKNVALSPCMSPRLLTALRWQQCNPVFIDLDPETLTMSARALYDACQKQKIAAVILHYPLTGWKDMLPLHDFCRQNDILCILDASGSFGSTLNGRSLLDFGDYALCSLHASQIFHTAEGGFIVSRSSQKRNRLECLRSGGQATPDEHVCYGINAHMSELHAAFGLSLLPLVEEGIAQRHKHSLYYSSRLAGLPVTLPASNDAVRSNNAVYPVLLPSADTAREVMQRLARKDIFPRLPYLPLLTQLPYLEAQYRTECPVAADIASRLVHLPLFDAIPQARLDSIIQTLSAIA